MYVSLLWRILVLCVASAVYKDSEINWLSLLWRILDVCVVYWFTVCLLLTVFTISNGRRPHGDGKKVRIASEITISYFIGLSVAVQLVVFEFHAFMTNLPGYAAYLVRLQSDKKRVVFIFFQTSPPPPPPENVVCDVEKWWWQPWFLFSPTLGITSGWIIFV